MTLDLPGTLFLQTVGLAPGIPLLRSCSAFYVNLPLEAIGREINTELLEVEVLAACSKNAFHSALLPVQRNSLFRIGDCCCSPGQRSNKKKGPIYLRVPWVPEAFHSRFPVSFKSKK